MCASNIDAESSHCSQQSYLSSSTLSSAPADIDSDSDYVVIDKTSSLSVAVTDNADKNINKLLKFVADNDIQMVSIFCSI